MKRENKGLVRQIHPPYVVAGKCGGFTLMELLITLAIISLLVGLLLPAFSAVRKAARDAKQKAQLTTIELALVAFKNDYGDYPPSDRFSHDVTPPVASDYCGAQKLAEALLGRDLLGFHPKSTWSATDLTFYPINPTPANLNERKGPYLELATANAFRLREPEGLFPNTALLNPDRYVLCDVFGAKKVTVITPIINKPLTFYAGTPILYFKANTSSKSIEPPMSKAIYNDADNKQLIDLGRVSDGKKHPLLYRDYLTSPVYDISQFINYIMDPKASTGLKPWPYRPDSYILISAGADGFYGTPDDIRNFGY